MQGTEIVGITAGECEDPVKVTKLVLIYNLFVADIIFFPSSKFPVLSRTSFGVLLSFILVQVEQKY